MGINLLLTLEFLVALLLLVSSAAAKPNCDEDRLCGDVSIPFPFGMSRGCYLSRDFLIYCNRTFDPPRAFLRNPDIRVLSISVEGQIRVQSRIAHDCWRNGKRKRLSTQIPLPRQYMVNHAVNKFTILGCDTTGQVFGKSLNRNYATGCTSQCDSKADLVEGSCTGIGCCQMSIPKNNTFVQVELYSYSNYEFVENFNPCGYGFIAEETAFRFSPDNFTNLQDVEGLPMVVDWAVGNETCEQAQKHVCKSENSRCEDPENGSGYRCLCEKGYRGNPYLHKGCEDINECNDPSANDCLKDRCVNKPGNYECSCPKGFRGDGRIKGQGCYRFRDNSLELKLVTGIAVGVIALICAACLAWYEVRRRMLIRMKKTFFYQNGGMLLQEKLTTPGRSPDMAKLFSSSELKRATNNFHSNMIIGQGGFGMVYKGILPENKTIAIKKSKKVDPSQTEQFFNEVIILTQTRHRNVVRLMGCCLETETPLLVYEFVDNGTLYESIHKKKARFLNWELRLKIAAEAADAISYLHYAASIPIVHRDIKSANILLDSNFTAKVSDFGASRLIPMDEMQLTTMVQGTLGYLDPEYLQTNQLTEKSDVYSFGVVLLELLTGRNALSYNVPEEEINLANFFLYVLQRGQLFDILEDNIAVEENIEQVTEVAMLAKRCLNVKGEDRPTMKEVARELDKLSQASKNSRDQSLDGMLELESIVHIS